MNFIRDNLIEPSAVYLLKQLASVDAALLPKHIGFIMDGNRRYARKSAAATIEGHIKGYNALQKVLEHCMEIKCKEVTTYAFSLENFKRSLDEVYQLMRLFEDKLDLFMREDEWVNRNGVRVRFRGDLSRLENGLQLKCRQVTESTAGNSNCLLTICVAYTSRDEIVRTLKAYDDVTEIHEGKVDVSLFEECMGREYPLDLLIRTSGETRLSDFMLYEVSRDNSVILFVRKLWPEFGILDLLWCLIMYMTNRYYSAK
ncbi:hypothetical protein MP638_006732 [Amoeboaphelidium occidentale]|nr:hypothetical protein MP638_006732 [Amoeboaphelidium occidentale]